MDNPFKYGRTVSGKSFADREDEIKTLLSELKGGQNIIFYSPRRYGKSSLVLNVLRRLEKEKYPVIYVDLFRVTSQEKFLELYLSAIAKGTVSKISTFIKSVMKFVPNLALKVVIKGSQGFPEVELAYGMQEKDLIKLSERIYEYPQEIARTKGKQVIVIFDEFQEISRINGEIIERELRTIIQHHDRVSYVFMGSKRHLLMQIFSDVEKPLYKSGKTIVLDKIHWKKFKAFIMERFKEGSFVIKEEIAEEILKLTGNHPYYTQQLCHELWELGLRRKEVTEKSIDLAVKEVVTHNLYAYNTIWDNLPTNQRSLLLGLAESLQVDHFSHEFVVRYKLKTASNIQRSVRALEEKELLEREDEKYTIVDPFLRVWLCTYIG